MKTRYTAWVILALLTTSCESRRSQSERTERVNSSALYDPPTVTLTPGREYEFREGTLTGRGQKFHSHHSYLRALRIGE